MTCLSDVDKKLIEEKKPDIFAGVGLISNLIESNDNEDEGLLLLHYSPDAVTLDIKTRLNLAADEVMMSAVIAAMMSRSAPLKRIMINAVETFKDMAHG